MGSRYPFAMVASTPCTKVCMIDAAGRACRGCGRTLEEIGQWSGLTEAERLAIMARLTKADTPVAPIT